MSLDVLCTTVTAPVFALALALAPALAPAALSRRSPVVPSRVLAVGGPALTNA